MLQFRAANTNEKSNAFKLIFLDVFSFRFHSRNSIHFCTAAGAFELFLSKNKLLDTEFRLLLNVSVSIFICC